MTERKDTPHSNCWNAAYGAIKQAAYRTLIEAPIYLTDSQWAEIKETLRQAADTVADEAMTGFDKVETAAGLGVCTGQELARQYLAASAARLGCDTAGVSSPPNAFVETHSEADAIRAEQEAAIADGLDAPVATLAEEIIVPGREVRDL